MPSCSVFGCRSHPIRTESGITFHKFPKDVERRKAWIEALCKKDWEPTENARVCSLHFEERFMDRTSVNSVRLKKDAVPTLFDKTRPSYTKASKVTGKECSRVSETLNVVDEETGSCSKDDLVSDELSDSSSKLTIIELKRKIEYLELQNELKSKKIKSLQGFKRRAVKKLRIK